MLGSHLPALRRSMPSPGSIAALTGADHGPLPAARGGARVIIRSSSPKRIPWVGFAPLRERSPRLRTVPAPGGYRHSSVSSRMSVSPATTHHSQYYSGCLALLQSSRERASPLLLNAVGPNSFRQSRSFKYPRFFARALGRLRPARSSSWRQLHHLAGVLKAAIAPVSCRETIKWPTKG